MFGNKKDKNQADQAKVEKTKKEKVKVDYKNDKFVTTFKKKPYSDSNFSGLILQIKFKDGYGGYKTTYEATKALKNKDHSRD